MENRNSQGPQTLQPPTLESLGKTGVRFSFSRPCSSISGSLCVFAVIQGSQHKPPGSPGDPRRGEEGRGRKGEGWRLGEVLWDTPVLVGPQSHPCGLCSPVPGSAAGRKRNLGGTAQKQSICSAQILSPTLGSHRKGSWGQTGLHGSLQSTTLSTGPLSARGHQSLIIIRSSVRSSITTDSTLKVRLKKVFFTCPVHN